MIQHTHKNIISVFDYGRLSSFLYFIDMELCDSNLERWIYRNWDEATANKLPDLTAQLPSRARLAKTLSFVFPRQRSVEGYRFCIHDGGLFTSSIHKCLCMGYEGLLSTRTHTPKPIKIHQQSRPLGHWYVIQYEFQNEDGKPI